MTIYYLIVDKAKVASKSGNLPASNYGEMSIESLPFIGKVEFGEFANTKGLNFFYKKPDKIDKDQTLIKVDIADQAMNECTLKKYKRSDCMRVIANTHDGTLTAMRPEREVGLKVTVVSQVLPNGAERLKQHAVQDESREKKPADPKREKQEAKAVSVMQRAIDAREKAQSKGSKDREPPTFQH
jgi:hypothetical protein